MEIDEIEENVLRILKKYYPFIVFFILIFFLHLFMGKYADDVIFSKRLIDRTIPQLIVWRYNTLTARVIIDCILSIIAKENMVFWRILDSVIYTFGVYYAIKFVNDKKEHMIAVIGVLLFLMYPFCDMSTAGWMATTINYLWTFSFGVISLLPIVNSYRNEKTPAFMYVICTLCLIFAANHEQACAILFGLNLIFLLDCLINGKKINKFNILAIAVTIISFTSILYCPGTSLRYAWEVSTRYPEFANFGVAEKLYLGIVPTFNILISNKVIIAIFVVVLNAAAAFKSENLKIWAYANIGLILSLTLLSSIAATVFPGMSNILSTFALTSLPNLLSKEAILAVLISLYFVFSSMALLYKVFDKNLFYPFLLFVGFMSRLVVGFSPTVFFSSSRTAIFLYMILTMLTLMIIKKLHDEKRIDEKHERILTVVFALFALLNYLNVFIMMV